MRVPQQIPSIPSRGVHAGPRYLAMGAEFSSTPQFQNLALAEGTSHVTDHCP